MLFRTGACLRTRSELASVIAKRQPREVAEQADVSAKNCGASTSEEVSARKASAV
ncbi:MAG: hypothetical protein HDT36_02510 [Clostridiales bacterium]|nr:hypothetical protein [Clostridiales bacterium]